MRGMSILASALLLLSVSTAFAQPVATSICAIQDGRIAVNTEVFVDSLVATALDLKPSTYGIYCQQANPCPEYPNGEYCGVLVYMNYARPDTVEGVGIELGDLFSVRGNVEEYPSGGVPSVTEIAAPADAYAPVVHIIQKGYGVPTAKHLTVHDFGTDPADSANCEKWEGVYCRVDSVICTEWYLPYEYAEWGVVEWEDYTGKSTDTLRVDDKCVDPSLARPNLGDSLTTVLGVFNFEYGNYKILPPTNDHVIYHGTPPAPNLLMAYSMTNSRVVAVFDRDVSEASAAIKDNFGLETVGITASQRNPGDLREVLIDHTAPVAGTVELLTACNVENEFGRPMPACQSAEFVMGILSVADVQTPSSGDTSQHFNRMVSVEGVVTGESDIFGGFYLGTEGGGPYTGVYTFDSSHNRARGDRVIVAAVVNEYYGYTELYLPEYVSGPIFPPGTVAPTLIPITDIPGSAEQWEGVLVRLEEAEVATFANVFGEFMIHRGTDSLEVDDLGDYTYDPVRGDSLNIQGLLEWSFEDWTLQPRDDGDIQVYHVGAVGDEALPLQVVELRSYPNPFNPKTVLEFGISSALPVKLSIYDVNGRLVRTLVDENLNTGTYRVHWNGNDADGHPAAAGVYYCRLEAGDRLEMKKLVMVK